MPWCPECSAEYREGFTRYSECGRVLMPDVEDAQPWKPDGIPR